MANEIVQATAAGKYLRMSSHKVRRVIDQIRGKTYKEALLILRFMPYKPCPIIIKILESAVSNIKYKNTDINLRDIKILKIYTDKGPTMKRFQPRAQGRAFPIHKPTCHITVVVGVE